MTAASRLYFGWVHDARAFLWRESEAKDSLEDVTERSFDRVAWYAGARCEQPHRRIYRRS
jgi:hypothetical protein